MIYVGTAGWSIPKELQDRFPKEGSHLERYSHTFSITEINRTFYSLPQPKTLRRWCEMIPKDFRFSVKAHKSITHIGKLQDQKALRAFFEGIKELEAKLFVILFQLPPSLQFNPKIARDFLTNVRSIYEGYVAMEPRHESWQESEELLREFRVSRVAADPLRFEADAHPGGYEKFVYYRLHGSPKIYYSSYDEKFLHTLAKKIQNEEGVVIFDNTASGAAIKNALKLMDLLDEAE